MSDYPEHEKLKACKDRRDIVQDFYDWLKEQGYCIAHYPMITHDRNYEELDEPYQSDDLYEITLSPEKLFAAYFGIDYKAFTEEKEKLYRSLQGQS